MEADFTALIDELFVESRSVDNSPSPRLDAACVKYLEARGMVCLKPHTEAPTEEGLYVSIVVGENRSWAWGVNKLQAEIDIEVYNRDKRSCYAIGPLPEGK